MEMRDISRNRQPREGFSRGSIGPVCRNSPNDLHTIGGGHEHNRAAAYPVDGNTVDQVRMLGLLSGAHITGKKAERVSPECGKSEPSHLSPDGQLVLSWEEVYEALWQLKVFGPK